MSSLLRHYDELLKRAEQTVDDEYQARVMHQANSLYTVFSAYLSYACGAMLAWLLPGKLTILSMIPLIAPWLAYMESSRWMKSKAPRPRPWKFTRRELVIFVVLIGLWVGGMAYRSSEADFAVGSFIGAIVGGVLGGILMSAKMRKDRRKDQTRLEAELED